MVIRTNCALVGLGKFSLMVGEKPGKFSAIPVVFITRTRVDGGYCYGSSLGVNFDAGSESVVNNLAGGALLSNSAVVVVVWLGGGGGTVDSGNRRKGLEWMAGGITTALLGGGAVVVCAIWEAG